MTLTIFCPTIVTCRTASTANEITEHDYLLSGGLFALPSTVGTADTEAWTDVSSYATDEKTIMNDLLMTSPPSWSHPSLQQCWTPLILVEAYENRPGAWQQGLDPSLKPALPQILPQF